MGAYNPAVEEVMALVDSFMLRCRRDVAEGKSGALHEAFALVTRLKPIISSPAVDPTTAELFDAYLAEVRAFADAKGIVLDGPEKDRALRAKLIMEAEDGNRVAMMELSRCYMETKHGFEKDLDKRIHWLVEAAKAGSEIAIFTLYFDSRLEGSLFLTHYDDDAVRKLEAYQDLSAELVERFGVDLDGRDPDPDGDWLYIPDEVPDFE